MLFRNFLQTYSPAICEKTFFHFFLAKQYSENIVLTLSEQWNTVIVMKLLK